MESNNNKTICVTGASGFIAAHAVKQLLEQGYRVRGTVRGTADKYPYLTSLEGADDRLELVQADLLTNGAFDAVVEGCEYVLHTASPYIVDVKDPQKELVDPAVKGTTNVLDSCAKSTSVKRVVLTSSIAAITDEPDSNKVFTEEDWNTKSSLSRNPYYYSKTKAEQAAWSFFDQNTSLSFDMVVINPYMVIGPSLGPSLNTSNKIFRDVLSGKYPTIMNINWGFVDVRDVAKAHILAMENPDAKGRYLCANEVMTMKEVISFLKESGYNKYPLPMVNLASHWGNKVMKVLSYTQPKGSGTYMRTHIGRTMRYDNSKIKNDLQIHFIEARQSIKEAITDMLQWKHLKARG
ncbi:SDR family oxidoreductase [Litoribacillus peritrichatus]|uniref:NAD-dependent epimerase/dehydratase family protein n=1 Tax=Litoribacillus peritrichatus TaxID=718191 RepID=A0ABP7MTP3_9GAMM